MNVYIVHDTANCEAWPHAFASRDLALDAIFYTLQNRSVMGYEIDLFLPNVWRVTATGGQDTFDITSYEVVTELPDRY